MANLPPCFKANDIRGLVPSELNESLASDIARAFAEELAVGSLVVLGRDTRLESPSLAKAIAQGLQKSGMRVLDIGLCGTEEVYFFTSYKNAQAGIMVTASHNPKGYNGMKLVREGSRPIGTESGLNEIGTRALQGNFRTVEKELAIDCDYDKKPYIEKLLEFVDVKNLKPFTIVADSGHGTAGPTIDLLEKILPVKFVKVGAEPNGNFPLGVPDPLKEPNQARTRAAVLQAKADLGVAWDGDYDRCFLFDSDGRFIDGYYLVGLLGEVLAAKEKGARVVHDYRLVWNTIERVKNAGGEPIQERTGHVFMKERMRKEKAVYGGEMSSHHFFRDFYYCDSGMLPWLLVAELMSKTNKSLKELIDEAMTVYPCSGDKTYKVSDPKAVVAKIASVYKNDAQALVDTRDGLSVEYPDWRFNVRASNTEPVLRITLETRGDVQAVGPHLRELERLIEEKN